MSIEYQRSCCPCSLIRKRQHSKARVTRWGHRCRVSRGGGGRVLLLVKGMREGPRRGVSSRIHGFGVVVFLQEGVAKNILLGRPQVLVPTHASTKGVSRVLATCSQTVSVSIRKLLPKCYKTGIRHPSQIK
jgi:hypothetical protein